MEPVTLIIQIAAQAITTAPLRHAAFAGVSLVRSGLPAPREITVTTVLPEPSPPRLARPCVCYVQPGHMLVQQVRINYHHSDP